MDVKGQFPDLDIEVYPLTVAALGMPQNTTKDRVPTS